VLEKTLDMEGILRLASEATPLEVPENLLDEEEAFGFTLPEKLRIGVASDEAFCFFYEDNFRLLREMGAELVFFSPVHDKKLPEKLSGLLLYGGYPELHGEALEQNESMRQEIQRAVKNGMPCMAECGGFMYLHEEMEDMDGKIHRMAGVLSGRAYRTGKLTRFGYVTLTSNKEAASILGEKDLGAIPAHEFHYFDSTNCGSDLYAKKPTGNRGWECVHADDRMMAGFPHLYYYANPRVARAFLKQCKKFAEQEIPDRRKE
jgi:cobyrinic acid a,c-diamide synthase